MNSKVKVNWVYTLFFTLTPALGIFGTLILILLHHIAWQTWLLAGSFLLITGLSITAGYHRLFAHGSYKVVWPIKLIFLLFSTAAFQGSALEWCSDHINHHRYVDTDKDPYNIKRGFWFAHMGWIFLLEPSKRNFDNVKELRKNPLIHYQDRFYFLISILMGLILPTLIASLWSNPIGGLIVAGFLRITLVHQCTFAINSFCHKFGQRTYIKSQTACDNWVAALLTFGEGYHNFHHKFARDYRNGIHFYQFDPTKWLINMLSWFGLAYDLKRIHKRRILQFKIRTQADSLSAIWSIQGEHKTKNLYTQLLHTLSRVDRLEKRYEEFKATRSQYFSDKINNYQSTLNSHYIKIKAAKRQLKQDLSEWSAAFHETISQCNKVY